MFKKKILSKYLGGENIIYIISHHWWIYIKLIVFYLFLLLIGFELWFVVSKYINSSAVRYIFGIYWIVLYLKFIISFFDLYLDSIVLTNQGLNIFLWDWLFKYSNEVVEWSSIEAVYDEQNGLLDILLDKWDIVIKRIDEEYKFEDVPSPSKLSNLIMDTKDKILWNQESEREDNNEEEIDKFEILVEALGEIIKEYYEKKK